ncbi:enoyl-CoA hydratase/isomerase family protein [Arvimicrobium flavum]|uniref:enoyl-CoA hydratase/isomerase family protein n=1 Tax=Arvimicrobium flavum TaxID=3393320 RepID=UPI00237C22F5|nr:enoyl-CoA hydratase/isomerase family protein [Mesorhizobium shangrilense]
MSDYDRFETILASQADGVLTLTLNRPDSLNAVGGDMHVGLEHIFREVAGDKSVRAVLLTGAGRAFCVGGDVKGFAAKPEPQATPSPGQRVFDFPTSPLSLVNAMLDVPQPTVCALQGYAMGLGATIALLCDVVLAADDAQIADTHVPVGLVAGDGGALLWPLNMSFASAKYYLMTGERISGQEAARVGLVHRSVAADRLREEAELVARKLASLPPLAVQGTKKTLNRIAKARSAEVMETGLLYEAATFLSEDHREAIAAFAEKRPGAYSGR